MNSLKCYRLFRFIKMLFTLKIESYFNKLRFKAYLSFVGNFEIIGKNHIYVSKTAKVNVGRNFKLVSSHLINPLCTHPASISVGDGAIVNIGDNVGMSSPTIWIRKSLTIGNNVNFGGGAIILDSDAHSLNYLHRRDGVKDMANRVDKGIVVGDDVLIGMNVIILKGVHIGARSIIGAGSVVAKDIPCDCIAAGNPARVVKQIN